MFLPFLDGCVKSGSCLKDFCLFIYIRSQCVCSKKALRLCQVIMNRHSLYIKRIYTLQVNSTQEQNSCWIQLKLQGAGEIKAQTSKCYVRFYFQLYTSFNLTKKKKKKRISRSRTHAFAIFAYIRFTNTLRFKEFAKAVILELQLPSYAFEAIMMPGKKLIIFNVKIA